MDSSIFNAAAAALEELLECARLRPGQLVVIGCSSSEIVGQHIGKGSSPAAAQAVYSYFHQEDTQCESSQERPEA